jgi:hypothetical protein
MRFRVLSNISVFSTNKKIEEMKSEIISAQKSAKNAEETLPPALSPLSRQKT